MLKMVDVNKLIVPVSAVFGCNEIKYYKHNEELFDNIILCIFDYKQPYL